MLETGDAVKPKTGGPVMRIESYNPTNGKLTCRWAERNGVKREEFAPSELVAADPDEFIDADSDAEFARPRGNDHAAGRRPGLDAQSADAPG